MDEDATITAKTANIGSQAKRRRVVLSSDDEDENELMKMEVEEVTPSTPKQGRKNIVRILFDFENFMVVEIFKFHYSILEDIRVHKRNESRLANKNPHLRVQN